MENLEKKQIRKLIAEKKKLYSENTIISYSEKLFTHIESLEIFHQAKTVLLYYSLKDEVNTHFFIEKWGERKTILLPVVDGEKLLLKIYKNNNDLKIGAFGIKEPIGKIFSDYEKIDLAIIPGVSFDEKGNRLGRGKGYYDRLLPNIKAFKIGVCFDFQVNCKIPTESHDTKMDMIITEKGILNEK